MPELELVLRSEIICCVDEFEYDHESQQVVRSFFGARMSSSAFCSRSSPNAAV